MGKKRLAWILIFIFCFGFCTGGIVSRHFFEKEQTKPVQSDLSWLEECKEITSEGSSPYILVSWSERRPCQQYPFADWDGSTYCSSDQKIKEEKTGEFLGSFTAYGKESLNASVKTKNIWYVQHEKRAELYRIHGVSEHFAVAVRLEGEKDYYVYTRKDYVPETLGDFVEDLNLKEYLVISAQSQCGNQQEKTYFGDITDALWEILLSQKDAKIQRKPHHNFFVSDEEVGDVVFSTAVLYELTAWGHVTFYASEHGYIGINQPLLDPEYIFYIGEGAVEEFLKYIDAHCECVEEGQENAAQGDKKPEQEGASQEGENIGQKEEAQEENAGGGRMSEGYVVNPVIPWEEKEIDKQYPFADWEDGTYVSAKISIGQEQIGQYLCDLEVYGFEKEATTSGVRHKKNGKAYRIDQISERFAVAIRLSDEEKYYVYTREDYTPKTLGDFVNDLNLEKYLKVDTYAECGNALEKAYTGDIETVFWDILLSQKEVESQNQPHYNSKVWDDEHGFTVFETQVSYSLTGRENVLFYMSSKGYIGTELLPYGCVFCLGEDTAEKLLEYIDANCVRIEGK